MTIGMQLRSIVIILLIFGMVNMVSGYYQQKKMDSDARLVNIAGLVRGTTQRLVKIEMSGLQDVLGADDMISRLDKLVNGLKDGDSELKLLRPTDKKFLSIIDNVALHWEVVKELIIQVRSKDTHTAFLVKESEEYFTLTDEMVTTAEGIAKEGANKLSAILTVVFILNLLVCTAIWIQSHKAIIKPLEKLAVVATAIAGGDISQSVPADSKNEIGFLGAALNSIPITLRDLSDEFDLVIQNTKEGNLRFRGDTSRFEGAYRKLIGGVNLMVSTLETNIRQVAKNTSTVHESAAEMRTVAQRMGGNITSIVEEIKRVTLSSKHMSDTMENVSTAFQESSKNIHMVADAIEQIRVTVSEIARDTTQASNVTSHAVQTVDSASRGVNELGAAAMDIDKVTETIVEIAEQTKLLALNATIEAARAGEAGKGFAVVANEVKELAKQTSVATVDIRHKIEAIQSHTDSSMNEMGQISDVISEVNNIVTSIVSSVEEQSATTQAIAGNTLQVSNGIDGMSENIMQTAVVSRDMTANVGNISTELDKIEVLAGVLNSSAAKLARTGEDLKKLVEQFQISDVSGDGNGGDLIYSEFDKKDAV